MRRIIGELMRFVSAEEGGRIEENGQRSRFFLRKEQRLERWAVMDWGGNVAPIVFYTPFCSSFLFLFPLFRPLPEPVTLDQNFRSLTSVSLRPCQGGGGGGRMNAVVKPV